MPAGLCGQSVVLAQLKPCSPASFGMGLPGAESQVQVASFHNLVCSVHASCADLFGQTQVHVVVLNTCAEPTMVMR